MIAFAANSVLNRVAVDSGSIDPGPFAVIRVLCGALMLVGLTLATQRRMVLFTRQRLIGAGSLTLYMVGFSVAYRVLDAGLGALLIFGAVQIAIFAITALRGTLATGRQVLGSAVAFAGLAWVLWPAGGTVGGTAVDPVGAFAMLLAGLGWAVYTLAGRAEPDPIAGSAANFCVALPLTVLAVLLTGQGGHVTPVGAGWAVLSGAVTSGLFYAVWYMVVPRMEPAIAAISMLTVPIIALAAGILLLGESASLRLWTGAMLVIGGIAFAVWTPSRRDAV